MQKYKAGCRRKGPEARYGWQGALCGRESDSMYRKNRESGKNKGFSQKVKRCLSKSPIKRVRIRSNRV